MDGENPTGTQVLGHSSGPISREHGSPSRRPGVPEDKSLREISDRRPMEESQIPRIGRTRGPSPHGSGGREYDEERAGDRGQAERKGQLEPVARLEPERRERSRGKRERKRKERKELEREESHRGRSRSRGQERKRQQVKEEEDEKEFITPKWEERKEFADKWDSLLRGGYRLREVGYEMFETLPLLQTAFGRFKDLLESKAVAPGGPAAPTDVLPMNVEAIRKLENINEDVKDWGAYTVLCLNYFFCCGWEKATSLGHSAELSTMQKELLEKHIFPAVTRMLEGNPVIPHKEDILKELSKKGTDYEGSTYVVMEDLDAEKAVACWPRKEAAAVQPLTKFVKGATKEALEAPKLTLL